MRMNAARWTLLSLLTVSCAVAGCSDPESSLQRGRSAQNHGSSPGAPAEGQTPGSEAAAMLTLNGHLSSDGAGSVAQGLAGSDLLTVANTVDVMALQANGDLLVVTTVDVGPNGGFTATVPPASSPTGIFILSVKNLVGAVVGSGVVNGLPAFVKAFFVDAVVDTTTSFKAEILQTLAKKGVPGVQNYLNVIDAYVNAQLANTIAVDGVVGTDLTTLIGATGDAVVAAENVIVAALKMAGIPVDASALEKSQLAAVSGAEGVVMSAEGALVTGSKNLIASLEAASAAAAAPIDQAIFDAVVNGGAAFSAALGKGAAGKPGSAFAAIKAAFVLETSLTTAAIADAFAKSGASPDVLAAVESACAALTAAAASATSTVDLAAAKTQFTNALLGKGTPKPGGIIGLFMTVAADLQALWNSVDATMAPLTADLTAAIATADCGQIAAALAKFDDGAKALPAKLAAAISADEAAAVSTALTLIGKQVVP